MDSFTGWRIPGCAATVYKDGECVFEYASGYADCENGIKMTPDSLMYMYSASKPVTCTAALTLWEKGKFHLNEPVCTYLPSWQNMTKEVSLPDGTKKTVPLSSPVTVGDLFSMTSGLDYCLSRPSLTESIKRTAPICDTLELMDAVGGDPLLFEPGEKWCYGISHDVIGAIIQKISGDDLRAYAKKNIFAPLSMNSSYYGNGDIPEGLATQYSFNDEKQCFEKTDNKNTFILGKKYYSGGAGIVSTVRDMGKFACCLSMGGSTPKGERILAPTTVELMKANRLSPSQLESFNWEPLQGYGYGLGVRTLIDPAAAGSPSPVGEFGWTGAAGAYMLIDTKNRLALFYAHHMLNNQEHITSPRLRNTLYSCL